MSGTLAALTLWLTLGACTVLSSSEEDGSSAEEANARKPLAGEEALVAVDLVSVLMQLPALSPFATTVQFSPARSSFGEALVDAFASGGYGIQNVSDDQGLRYVSYRRVETESPRGPETSYAVRVAAIEVERRYARRGGRLVPVSAVRVVGTAPGPAVVNDDLFRQRVDADTTIFPSGVVFLDAHGEVIERRDRVVRVGQAQARASGERVNAERFLVLARANLFHADRLHRAPDARSGPGRAMWQVTLRFEDPKSLLLGEGNKRALARLRERFDPASDRFSISGCSHGKSLLWDGTESDALARSQRVKEELLLAGVPGSLLREEGCFNTRYGAALPPNSVIVTVERYPGVNARIDRMTTEMRG